MDICVVKNFSNSKFSSFSETQGVNNVADNLGVENHENQPHALEIEILQVVNKGSSSKGKISAVGKKSKIKKSKMKQNLGEKNKRKRKLSGNVDNLRIKRKKKDDNFLNANKLKTNKFSDAANENKTPNCSSTNNTAMLVIASSESQLGQDEVMEISSEKKLKTVSARKYKAVINACKKSLNILSNFDFKVLLAMDNSLSILNEHNFLNNKLISMPTLIELIRLAMENKKYSKEVVVEQEKDFSKILLSLTKETNLRNPKVKRNILTSISNSSIKSIEINDHIDPTFTVENFFAKELCEIQEKRKEKTRECETYSNLKKISDNESNEKCGKNFITNYFKKLQKSTNYENKKEKFGFLSEKTDIPVDSNTKYFTDDKRKKLEENLANQNYELNYLIEKKFIPSISGIENSKFKSKAKNLAPDAKKIENNSTLMAEKKINSLKDNWFGKENLYLTNKMKAKLLQFHDNRRPPYWGTWRRKSDEVKPKNPFGKDKMLNYEVDSDEEWEEEEEQGESLHGSDDEKEPEEDYEVDNDFFVPHGYLSDDENPEKEKVPVNLLEELSFQLCQKSKKMTPVVFGSYWLHNLSPHKAECIFEELQIERLKYVPWTSLPIEVKEDEERQKLENDSVSDGVNDIKKFKMKVAFPANEVPNLIKIIHGSPQNGDQLARKFLTQWQSLQNNQKSQRRSFLTKKCVLKKIKELASWQISQDRKKMCWLVPKETQKEFGTEIEGETTLINPQKCYIWKFIKKGDKTTGKPTEVPQDSDVTNCN